MGRGRPARPAPRLHAGQPMPRAGLSALGRARREAGAPLRGKGKALALALKGNKGLQSVFIVLKLGADNKGPTPSSSIRGKSPFIAAAETNLWRIAA